MSNEIAPPKLILTYFITPPLIEFGEKCERGKIFSAVLIVENKNDFVSTVNIVKFPKKNTELNLFSYEPNNFLTIPPFENACYTFFWKPNSVGNIRETVQFRINETYSLHAYLLGRSVLPVDDEIFLAPQSHSLLRKPFVPVQLTTPTGNLPQSVRSDEIFSRKESRQVFRENFSCVIEKRQTFLVKKYKKTDENHSQNDENDFFNFEKNSSETFLISSSEELLTEIEKSTSTRNVNRKKFARRIIQSETETKENKQEIRRSSFRTKSAPNFSNCPDDEEILRIWLNAILTPEIFQTDIVSAANRKIDVKKLLASVDTKTSAVPLTKEIVTSKIYSQTRLMNDLRRRAFVLYKNLHTIFKSVEESVRSGKIIVRKDKAIHADVGLKQFLLSVLFSVNPLWLRLGLETIYGEIIPLKNNNDRFGLTRFIVLRLFNDPSILARFGISSVRNYFKEGYTDAIGKFFLIKCLNLFIFLDKAKCTRLIVHDPCLFLFNSAYKTVNDVFCALTKEILSGEGNLFKQLNICGYLPKYGQTWLDEIHMPVMNLASDLRDGVRLARAFEILTGLCHLSPSLRGPPISRLQKIHNVDLVLKNLSQLQKNLFEDFDSKKVVGGHREETLELVWRMRMYFEEKAEAALKIQRWFRRTLARRRYMSIRSSTIKIQRWFRTMKRRQPAPVDVGEDDLESLTKLEILDPRSVSVVIGVQAFIRGFLARRTFIRRVAALKIQGWYRNWMETRKVRTDFLLKKHSIVVVQRNVRHFLEAKKKLLATLKIQRWYRSLIEMKKIRTNFLLMKRSAVIIQRNCRWFLRAKRIRQEHCNKELATVKIQRWFRNWIETKKIRQKFLIQKRSIAIIQRSCRLYLETKRIRLQNCATIKIQRWYRNWMETRKVRTDFLLKKHSIVVVQRNVRHFLEAKKNLLATLKIQRWYRSLIEMKKIRTNFLLMKRSAVIIQRNCRRFLQAKRIRQENCSKVLAAVKIQRWIRNLAETKKIRQEFLRRQRLLNEFKILCKRKIGENIILNGEQIIDKNLAFYGQILIFPEEPEDQRLVYCNRAAVKIQNWFRGNSLRKKFLRERKAVVKIQRWYRRLKVMSFETYSKIERRSALWIDDESVEARNVVEKSREELAAIKIQAIWRGFRTRRFYLNEQIVVIRRRLTILNKAMTQENTIEARTSLALDYLLNYDRLRYIEIAVEHLEIVTKFSPLSCTRLVDCGGVPILHKLIAEMNGSVACNKVVSRALSAIVNIVKYDVTRPALTVVKSWPSTLIHILESSKDYNEDIFLKAAVILLIMNKSYSDSLTPWLKSKLKSLCQVLERRRDLQVKKTTEKLMKTSGKQSVATKKPEQSASMADLFKPDWNLFKNKISETNLSRLESMKWVCRIYKI